MTGNIISMQFSENAMYLALDDGKLLKYTEANTSVLDNDTDAFTKKLYSNYMSFASLWMRLKNFFVTYFSDNNTEMKLDIDGVDDENTLKVNTGASFNERSTKRGINKRFKRFRFKVRSNADNFELFDIGFSIQDVVQKKLFTR